MSGGPGLDAAGLRRAAAVALLAAALPLTGCPPTDPPVDAGPATEIPEPDRVCPGSEGCASADGPLRAGASKRAFTPTGFEVARPSYLQYDRPDYCQPDLPSPGATTCGELKIEITLDDCGNDAICITHDEYEGPDADGSEGDGVTDFFLDCGRDRLCPGDEGYEAPDADGSEGDGLFQGLWIAGYGNNRPAMGVKDDLWARTVVFETGDVVVAMTTVDAVGFFYDEVVKIRERVETLRPGAIDLIIVQATHTHEAPDTLGQWGMEDPYAGLQRGHGRSDAHMEAIQVASVDSIVEAYDQLAPATIAVGTINTRVDGFLSDGRDPQIFNDLLTALHVTAEGGDTIATIVNWGNHPEILDSRNNYISSDFAHALRVSLEDGLPATDTFPAREGLGGVAIYQQGTVGGLIGPNGFEFTGRDGTVYENRYKSFERCDAYGELLADQAFSALEDAEVIEEPSLAFATQKLDLVVANRVFHVGFFNGWFDRGLHGFDEDAQITEDNLPNVATQVAKVTLGGIGWLTAPGEMFPETFCGFADELSGGRDRVDPENPNPPDLDAAPDGPYLKERTGAAYPILLGLALDEIGYLVPPYDFKLHEASPYVNEADGDHYEETNSLGPATVPDLMAAYEILLAD